MQNEGECGGQACGAIRVGISGWKYEPWRGTFYPAGLLQRRELEYASRALPSIEINSTFYRLQQPSSYANWYAQTPTDFVFSIKAPKLITHEHRLRNIAGPMAKFFASGLLNLEEKLGPILWQFPPSFRFDATLLEDFLTMLPHDTLQARALSETHTGSGETHTGAARALRHAVEIRHESFAHPAFVALLRRHRVALVRADTGGRWPEFEDVCSDFIYMRLHGATELHRNAYSEENLNVLAKRITCWAEGSAAADARLISDVPPPAAEARELFCFFDNTDKVEAPRNAMRLLAMLGMSRGAPSFELRGTSDISEAGRS